MDYWSFDIQNNLSGSEKKKFLNKKQIIKYLYRMGMLTGVELSKLLNLSFPTIRNYLNELIEEGYVELTIKGASIGGRRPNMYQLVHNSLYLIGINISQNKYEISIYNNKFDNISEKISKVISLQDTEEYVNIVCNHVKKIIKETNININKIIAVGIDIPGLIDSDAGISHTYFTKLSQPISKVFSEKLELPVYIENDSRSLALAELRHGQAIVNGNTLVIQVGWGVGMGMILNGQLYKGSSGFAGEFSHTANNESDELCTCGKTGCLETVASGRAMIKKAEYAIKNNEKTLLTQKYKENNNKIYLDDIIEAGKMGDLLALRIIKETGKMLGKGISYLVHILNPELIILTGVVSQAGEYLTTPIQQALLTYCMPKLRENTSVKISTLGKDSGTLGAATVAFDKLLST